MKTIIRTIAAVSAAVLALVSCIKENIPGGDGNAQTAKERVFTLSFNTTGTKTALNADGKTPEFQNGDLIKVFDGINSEELPVTVSGGQATVTVPGSISGGFKAVYPASAYQEAEPYFKVENIQDGTFAKANICLAEVPSGATKMTFTNQTVIFSFDVTSYEGTYIHVIAARDSISNTVVTGNTKINRIVIPAEDVAAIKESANKTCYVSVYLPQGKTLTCHDISFANGSKIKVPAKESSPVLVINNIFPVDMTSGWTEPYVEVNDLKWATKNIGATESNPNGDFFMWGYTVGHTAVGEVVNDTIPNAFSGQTFKEEEIADRGDNGLGFAWNNYIKFTSGTYAATPSASKKVFLKYVPKAKAATYGNGGTFSDDKTVLDLCDDAANANWGGSWRMPTQAEYEALLTATSTTNANFSNGVLTINGHSDLTFPAAGIGSGTRLENVGGGGRYWTSSLYTNDPSSADRLYFHSSKVYVVSTYRWNGNSVRALSD